MITTTVDIRFGLPVYVIPVANKQIRSDFSVRVRIALKKR
jgi:hypothetical protein